MEKTIKKIVKNTPRASFANPRVYMDEDGLVKVIAGSPADATRFIQAIRSAGYSCNTSPWDWRTIVVTNR